MLYVFYGNDELQVQQAVADRLASLREQDPTLQVERLEGARYTPGQIQNLLGSVALFGASPAYVLDTPSQYPEYKEEVLGLVAELAESSLVFIMTEKTILAAEKKQLTSALAVLSEFKQGEVKRFDTFSLANALAMKDKRQLWLLLQEARRNDIAAEEMIGILWWQLKTIRLAALTKSADEAGVKDFPYNKAKKALAAFKAGEVERLSRSLLVLYHDGHAGLRDIDLALEEWVLTI